MTQKENELFYQVVDTLKENYPNRNIEVKWDYDRDLVCVDGEVKFTTLEYNFLFNVTRLVNALNNELK